MKTRTIEIPVCDNCSKDGEVLIVTDGVGETFTIVKCPRHKQRLRDASEQAGHEVVTEPRPPSHKVTGLMDAVMANPGQRPKVYGAELGWSPQLVGKMAGILIREGSMRREGRELYPA